MKKYALIGEKLSHSLSPCIHEAVFGELDLEAGYTLMEIPARFKGHIVQKLWYEGYKGANVTIPYKQTVLRQLDVLSPAAEKIGAVNTIALRGGKFYGDNTDYDGFGKMLSINQIETEGKTAAVLGTGGAAKAVVAYLLDHGVKRLCLVSRQAHKKPGFEQPGIEWMEYAALPSLKGDILVNCTPVGMYPNTGVSPVDRTVVERFEALVDLIYNPRQTEFLRLGRLCGKTVCDGLYMLVAQAVRSEEIWQQRALGDEMIRRIYDALDERLSGPQKSNIVLIGMPGSGKTTIGRRIAKQLNYEFYEMDDTVVSLAGKSIPALFEEGEQVFRDWETEACRHLAQKQHAVIACGGGAVLREQNMELLKQSGVVYYLDRPVERIAGDIRLSTRPLLKQGKERLYQLYRERAELYENAADEIVSNEGAVKQTMQRLIDSIKRREALL